MASTIPLRTPHSALRTWCFRASAGLLLGALAAQCLLAMRVKSATYDEPFYISAGYAYLTRGRFELNPEHPPLMKYLIGLPLLFQDLRPLEQFPEWARAPQRDMAFGAAFLFNNHADPDRVLFWSRVPVLALSLLTGLLAWFWATRLYGHVAGVVALMLYCLCPNIVAHSGLATLDLGVTAGLFAAALALWRLYDRSTVTRMVLAGLALAAALLMKFSSVIVLALLPLSLAAGLLRHGRRSAHARRPQRRSPPLDPSAPRPLGPSRARFAAMMGGVLLIAAVLLTFAYGLGRFGIGEYVRGFRLGVLDRETLTKEGYQSFCWGRYSLNGFRYYHFAAFLIKTPLPALLLAAATVLRWAFQGRTRASAPAHDGPGAGARPATAGLRHGGSSASGSDSSLDRRAGWFDEMFLIAPIVLLFLITIPIEKNFGLRNVLPVYPFLFVLAGGTAAWLWGERRGLAPPSLARADASQPEKRRDMPVGKTLMALLAAWSVITAVRIHPDQLSYFNELIGGPSQGIRYLDDSNIDWGQDLKRLAEYVRDRGITNFRLLYFADYFLKPAAKHYGLEYRSMNLSKEIERPQPGWYAISAHLLQRPRLIRTSNVRFDWLNRFKPEAVIGHSIYVYKFE